MANPVLLLVGGTKILEGTLRDAVPAPQVVVGTIEEAMQVLGSREVGLVVFGPTLRRSLAMVSVLRREGATEPKLLVVYPDALRDEVKRHLRGKPLADRYIVQSRAGKDLASAAHELWLGRNRATTAELEEIPVEALEVLPEDATREMDISALLAAEQQTGGEVLGAFDAGAFAANAVEPTDGDAELVEEISEIELVEEGSEAVVEEIVLDDMVVEEVELEEVAMEEVEVVADGDVLEVVELDGAAELEPVELNDATVVEEVVEELDAIELVEELVEEPAAQATEFHTQATESPTQANEPAAQEAEPAEEAPAVVAVPTTRESSPQGASRRPAAAMFNDLLQELTATTERLEQENEQLRAEMAQLQAAQRDRSADEALALRLAAAEQARDEAQQSAVERGARGQALEAELVEARAQVQASDAQLLAVRAELAASQTKLAAAQAAAKLAAAELLQLAAKLEG
jgi:hypothetical protein